MIKNYTTRSLVTILLVCCFIMPVTAQVINGGIPGNFGVDGEVNSGVTTFGTAMPAGVGTHDWFKPATGTGRGIIDTSGAAALKVKLQAGENLIFTKGASFPKFTVQDTFLFIDAMYARDEYGKNSSIRDNTIFKVGSKNGQNPTEWRAEAGSCPDKTDIIDFFIHMRRNGTTVNNTNPSHLMLYMAANTVDNYGYLDFEMFRAPLSVGSNNKFENVGPDGGHSSWTFNNDGSVKQSGDMLIGFDYTPTAINNISAWIWVHVATYQTANPKDFAFVQGQFYGNTGFGYAKLKAKPGKTLQQWAVVNTSGVTPAAPWGTSSKDLGSGAANFSMNYSTGQFAEVALDLTSFGIDPALNPVTTGCQPMFSKIMVKTSASNQWTSELKDFAGPYNFINAVPSASTLEPAKINCYEPTRVMKPEFIVPGASYMWTTTDGRIISRPDTTTPVVSKKGYYTLTVTPQFGCGTPDSKTTRLKADFDQPVATAPPVRFISQLQPVTHLNGGDTLASNFPTEFGGSSGLKWDWSGPMNYASTIQSPPASNLGNYRLIATELRNGCKDTAITTVQWMAVLPVKIINFAAAMINKSTVDIKWITVGEEGGEKYILEKSTDGVNFIKTYEVDGIRNATINLYNNKDDISALANGSSVYYRVKAYSHDALYTITNVVKINVKNDKAATSILSITPSQGRSSAVLNFFTPDKGEMQVFVYDVNGKMLFQAKGMAEPGINNVQLPINNPGGTIKMKIVRLDVDNEVLTKKFLF